jgi:hypothetical protein
MDECRWTEAELIEIALKQAWTIITSTASTLDDPAALIDGLSPRDELESLTELAEATASILRSYARRWRGVLGGNSGNPEEVVWS